MIWVSVKDPAGLKAQLGPFLEYTTDKMAGARADSNDTATLAYVVLRHIAEGGDVAIVSNEGARAALRELRLFTAYASDKTALQGCSIAVKDILRQLVQEVERQDAQRWAKDRERIAKGRPTVREARRA